MIMLRPSTLTPEQTLGIRFCPACKAAGYDHHTDQVCTTCGGDGVVPILDATTAPQTTDLDDVLGQGRR